MILELKRKVTKFRLNIVFEKQIAPKKIIGFLHMAVKTTIIFILVERNILQNDNIVSLHLVKLISVAVILWFHLC